MRELAVVVACVSLLPWALGVIGLADWHSVRPLQALLVGLGGFLLAAVLALASRGSEER